MSRTRIASRLIVALAVCLLCGRGFAASIVPNQTINAVGEADPTGGVVQAGTGVAVPFTTGGGAGGFSGTLTTKVISGDPSNALGGLTFTYLISNDAVSVGNLERMTNLNFTGFLTDVSYQTPAGGVIPTTIDRDASGSTMGWTFNPPGIGNGVIQPGQSSALLVVQTNAPAFVAINANIIDGSTAVAASWGPAVPEPASLTLLGLGLISIGSLSQRRKRR